MKYKVIVFHDIYEAMDFEDKGKKGGLKGRLIPLPSIIDAGCGMAWREPIEEGIDLEDFLRHKSYLKVVEMGYDIS